MIGPYQIIRLIGKGGMGEVFLAYDQENKRHIAIKRMLPEKINKGQFLNEARIASQLNHSSIVPIYSIVEEAENVYYTMPYIEGNTLKLIVEQACKRMQEGMPLDDSNCSVKALSLAFFQICKAVAFAHSKGFMHRDIKPTNIIIDHNGDVHLLDWGLAANINQNNSAADKSAPVSISGTLIYLAPELIEGAPPSPKTEIYSLGLILYEMLTLRYPFHRETIEKYYQNRDRESLIDPAKAAPYRGIPSFLSKIALKCLYPPEGRYKTVEEILYDFEQSQCDKAIASSMQSPLPRPAAIAFPVKFLYFIDNHELMKWPESVQYQSLAGHLAFLQNKAEILGLIFDHANSSSYSPMPILMQTLIGLLHLGAWELAREKLNTILQTFLDIQAIAQLRWVEEALNNLENFSGKISFLKELPKNPPPQCLFPLILILDEAIIQQDTKFIIETVDHLIMQHGLSPDQIAELDSYLIWAYLIEEKWVEAEKLVQWHLSKEEQSARLDFLNQCWVYKTEGKLFELPKITENSAFWQKKIIYSQYALFYHLRGDNKKECYYKMLASHNY